MILGAVGRELSPDPGRGFTLQASDVRPGQVASRVYRSARPIGTLDARDSLIADAASGAWLAFSGNPLLVSAAGVIARGAPLNAARLLAMLEADGVRALDQVDGQFAIAWWSARRGMLSLIRDRFGMESLCYSSGDRQLVFGTLARDVAASVAARPGLSMQGVVEYLTHCYLPGTNTLFEGIFRVPAGALVEYAAATGSCRVNYWYRLSYANPLAPDEAAIATHYREMLEASVVRRLSDDRTGVFLSGGMDSSSAATFARKHLSGPISSYSFRCLGASFDESPFARELARELGTEHTEVDFGELQSLDAVAAVGAMDMPFCDIGIEIGTWLLAKGGERQRRLSAYRRWRRRTLGKSPGLRGATHHAMVRPHADSARVAHRLGENVRARERFGQEAQSRGGSQATAARARVSERLDALPLEDVLHI